MYIILLNVTFKKSTSVLLQWESFLENVAWFILIIKGFLFEEVRRTWLSVSILRGQWLMYLSRPGYRTPPCGTTSCSGTRTMSRNTILSWKRAP